MASWWQRDVIAPGKLPLMLCFLAFVITFVVTRTITRMIRDGRGPFRNQVTASGTHVHHSVPGIILLISGAFTAVGGPDSLGWRSFAAVAVGIGTSLVLDEFALHLARSHRLGPGPVPAQVRNDRGSLCRQILSAPYQAPDRLGVFVEDEVGVHGRGEDLEVPVSQVENEPIAGRSGRSPVRRPDVAGCSPSARSSSDQTPGASRNRRRSCDHHGTGESSHTCSAATRPASPALPAGCNRITPENRLRQPPPSGLRTPHLATVDDVDLKALAGARQAQERIEDNEILVEELA